MASPPCQCRQPLARRPLADDALTAAPAHLPQLTPEARRVATPVCPAALKEPAAGLERIQARPLQFGDGTANPATDQLARDRQVAADLLDGNASSVLLHHRLVSLQPALPALPLPLLRTGHRRRPSWRGIRQGLRSRRCIPLPHSCRRLSQSR